MIKTISRLAHRRPINKKMHASSIDHSALDACAIGQKSYRAIFRRENREKLVAKQNQELRGDDCDKHIEIIGIATGGRYQWR